MLRGPGHAIRGAPVAQGPLRYYQGAPLVALFHPKGSQGPSCAQGALPSVQRGPVAHSGAVGNQGPFISLRRPFGSTEGPFISSGILSYVQRDPVAHSGTLGSQGPLQLVSGAPRLPKGTPPVQGPTQIRLPPPPPLQNNFRRH